jgi:hypothetical protein
VKMRLLLAAGCILSLPILFAPSQEINFRTSTPSMTVALAGRIFPNGAWCQCGCAYCICDPGETPSECVGGQSFNKVSDKNQRSGQAASPISNPASGIDFGSGAMLLALALFVWSRVRAF